LFVPSVCWQKSKGFLEKIQRFFLAVITAPVIPVNVSKMRQSEVIFVTVWCWFGGCWPLRYLRWQQGLRLFWPLLADRHSGVFIAVLPAPVMDNGGRIPAVAPGQFIFGVTYLGRNLFWR
jgi:hypothetical protein